MMEVYATTTPSDGPGCANEEGVVAKFVVLVRSSITPRKTDDGL